MNLRRLCSAMALAAGLVLSGAAGATEPLPAGGAYDLGFSPDGSALKVVLEAIAAARSSIRVAAYEFTSKPIALALLQARARGVRVMVVADAVSGHKRYSALTFLANEHLPVRLDDHYGIFHHKFLLIDNDSVETGSFNYTSAAVSRNAENALVLWHVPTLAARYGQEWQRLWDESRDLPPAY